MISDDTRILAQIGDQIIDAENDMEQAIADKDVNRQFFIQGVLDTLKRVEQGLRYHIAKHYN